MYIRNGIYSCSSKGTTDVSSSSRRSMRWPRLEKSRRTPACFEAGAALVSRYNGNSLDSPPVSVISSTRARDGGRGSICFEAIRTGAGEKVAGERATAR